MTTNLYDIYDYVIVGGGPCGLTCALYLSKQGKKCCLIDKNDQLGGIHRVTRVNELFTEHGPRVYSSAYVNFRNILRVLGTNFENLFVKYRFNISTIGGEGAGHLNIDEKMSIIWQFIKLTFGLNKNYLENTSVETFAKTKNFSPDSIDYLDRICRLTDGAGAEKYSMFEFLQLINQNTFYKLYQPKFPNDKKLFFLWEQKLLQNNVTILKNTEVLDYYTQNNLHVIKCVDKEIKGDKVIFCIPPKPFVQILEKNNNLLQQWSLYNKIDMREWALFNSYFNYIPISFHWRNKQSLPKIWGFPKEDWGIAFIILSDYMTPNVNNIDFKNGMMISTCITRPESISKVTGKTAYQSNEEEVKKEVFRQLKISFPQLEMYDMAIIHPKVKYSSQGNWQEEDTAYIKTYKHEFVNYKIPDIKGMYFVGTQNGNSFYSFTSLESAVTNAFFYLRDEEKINITIEKPFELVYFLRILIVTILILFLYYKLR
jgi:hypothetical protein